MIQSTQNITQQNTVYHFDILPNFLLCLINFIHCKNLHVEFSIEVKVTDRESEEPDELSDGHLSREYAVFIGLQNNHFIFWIRLLPLHAEAVCVIYWKLHGTKFLCNEFKQGIIVIWSHVCVRLRWEAQTMGKLLCLHYRYWSIGPFVNLRLRKSSPMGEGCTYFTHTIDQFCKSSIQQNGLNYNHLIVKIVESRLLHYDSRTYFFVK